MKLMVIDGNSIINRSFYGIRPLSTREGLFTHAVYGFVTTMQRLSSRKPCVWPLTGGSLPSATRQTKIIRLPATPCPRSWPCRCRC